MAGSKRDAHISFHNMIKYVSEALVYIFHFASYNPARAIGLYDRGEIAKGKRADLVFIDYKMKVHKVI